MFDKNELQKKQDQSIMLRLTSGMIEECSAIAKKEGIHRIKWIRKMIFEAITNYKERDEI